MSKKKFIDGLESLFAEPTAQELRDANAWFQWKGDPEVRKDSNELPSYGEKTTTSFRDLLEKSLEESLKDDDLDDNIFYAAEDNLLAAEEECDTLEDNHSVEGTPVNKDFKPLQKNAYISNKKRKPLSGLDILIRRTVDPSAEDYYEQFNQRLTLTFDKSLVKKLKLIARRQGSSLFQVVKEVMSKFVKEFESQKGKLEE